MGQKEPRGYLYVYIVGKFEGGYGEGKSRVIRRFFIGCLYEDCECNADTYLWEMHLLVGYYI